MNPGDRFDEDPFHSWKVLRSPDGTHCDPAPIYLLWQKRTVARNIDEEAS